MTSRAREFRRTHAPELAFEPVLDELRRVCDKDGAPGPSDLESLARTVHLPVAALRGALSSYSDVGQDHHAVRVCAGTSCLLSSDGSLRGALAGTHCDPVYCLGYCDRAPAAMTLSGRVVVGVSARDADALVHDHDVPHLPPPSVRCTAKTPIVTARLLPGAEVSPGDVPSYAGLQAALRLSPGAVIDAVIAAGVKGRGGAAYPTGTKWRLAARASGTPKFVVANGDEGDPGSFIDRELMERDPHAILEGMAICGHAVGASSGIVFIRSEYPLAARIVNDAIAAATKAGVLGDNALGPGKPFHVSVVRGLGSYVCGEETALLSAIEGQRGEVRPRPPYPVEQGLYGKPTVVDNVETLVNVPWIMSRGTEAFAAMGTPDSRGTKAVCLNRGFARPGIVEIEFGVPLREVIHTLGGGGAEGRELEAVLLGGPMGSIVTPDQWDVPVCFVAMAKRRINLGHAGLVAIPRGADWNSILRHLLAFMKDESCGKCVPCRLGGSRVQELVATGQGNAQEATIRQVLALMQEASLCAFGRETPGPVLTILDKFGARALTGSKP